MKDKEYYKQFLTNTNVVAYLNAISRIEGPTYYTANGGTIYRPTGPEHPDRVFSGGTTEAFGRYQFMYNTWTNNVEKAIGKLDIREPRDQDIAAIYLLDYRGTLDKIVAGDCKGSLNANAFEWAAIPKADGSFAYNGQGGPFDANGFCKLFDKLKGTTLPEGPLVNNNAPNLLGGLPSAASGGAQAVPGGANFSDINCPPIKEEDLYRANFQITNPGCKISGPIQPITGPSTNGGTVNNNTITNNSAGFSLNSQGFAACSSLRSPTKGVAPGSPFGWRATFGRNHNGLDLPAPEGTPIYAASNGIITYAAWEGGFGNLVIIMSPEKIETKYAHLSAFLVKEGQQVTIGQEIAKMGNTGFSFGAHLHFEIRINGGGPIDPQSCMKFT